MSTAVGLRPRSPVELLARRRRIFERRRATTNRLAEFCSEGENATSSWSAAESTGLEFSGVPGAFAAEGRVEMPPPEERADIPLVFGPCWSGLWFRIGGFSLLSVSLSVSLSVGLSVSLSVNLYCFVTDLRGFAARELAGVMRGVAWDLRGLSRVMRGLSGVMRGLAWDLRGLAGVMRGLSGVMRGLVWDLRGLAWDLRGLSGDLRGLVGVMRGFLSAFRLSGAKAIRWVPWFCRRLRMDRGLVAATSSTVASVRLWLFDGRSRPAVDSTTTRRARPLSTDSTFRLVATATAEEAFDTTMAGIEFDVRRSRRSGEAAKSISRRINRLDFAARMGLTRRLTS